MPYLYVIQHASYEESEADTKSNDIRRRDKALDVVACFCDATVKLLCQ